MKKIIFLAFITISLAGCNTIRPLPYFSVTPYAKPFENKINKPVYILLSKDIGDTISVEGIENPTMNVLAFRYSLEDALKSMLSNNFSGVKFLNYKVDTGICLVIYRVHPFWKYGGSYSHYNVASHSTTTSTRTSVVFQYASTLYYNGLKINTADGECTSNSSCSDNSEMRLVFQDGTQVFCEELYRTLFTDEVVQRIR